MKGARAALQIALVPLATMACGKGAAPNAAAALAGDDVPDAAESHAEPMGAREMDAWARAKDGDDEDRMRLVDLVGCAGLRERADDAERRPTAIRAMAFCSDFSELPWLASVATSDDPTGVEALEATLALAARPRRATDPEDAEELGAGCRTLLGFARTLGAPRARRVVAIRALRMLADRGCVGVAEIPRDLDAK